MSTDYKWFCEGVPATRTKVFFIAECWGRHSKKHFLIPKKNTQHQLSAPLASPQLPRIALPELKPFWCYPNLVSKQGEYDDEYLLHKSLPGSKALSSLHHNSTSLCPQPFPFTGADS